MEHLRFGFAPGLRCERWKSVKEVVLADGDYGTRRLRMASVLIVRANFVLKVEDGEKGEMTRGKGAIRLRASPEVFTPAAERNRLLTFQLDVACLATGDDCVVQL
jgi:hypothetical protein